MNSMLLIFLCAALLVAVMIFIAQFFGPLVMSYKITGSSFEVRVFGVFLASKTEFSDVVEMRKVSFAELLPWKNLSSVGWFRLANRFSADGVLIRRSRGVFRAFVITPNKPDEFVKEFDLRLRALRGGEGST
jgi:hypothetical protein